MPTYKRTLTYVFPPITGTLADNVLTALTQINVEIDEAALSGITFSSVIVEMWANDLTATAVNFTTPGHTIQCSLGGGAAVSGSGAILTNSGENISTYFSIDATAHFQANWTPGQVSETLDCSVLINGNGTGMTNVCVKVRISYDYDSTATTQTKTVYLPLNAPTGALGTTKPGTATAVIPALDTFLEESGKVYRQIWIEVEGNDCRGNTIASTLRHQIDTLAQYTSGTFQGSLSSSQRYMNISIPPAFDTSVAHDWFLWGLVAMFNHPQCRIGITYSYDESASTRITNMVEIGLKSQSPMGGTLSTDAQELYGNLYIEEPGTLTLKAAALFVEWSQVTSIASPVIGFNAGSYTTYTDAAAIACGGSALMKDVSADISLAAGKNAFTAKVYSSDGQDHGWSVGASLLLVYSSDKSTKGSGAHNHTVMHLIDPVGSAAATSQKAIAAESFSLPETEFYINSMDLWITMLTNGTTVPGGAVLSAELLSGEGGPAWIDLFRDVIETDAEVGWYKFIAPANSQFMRWPGDPDSSRLSVANARRLRFSVNNYTTVYCNVTALITYHSMTFEFDLDIQDPASSIAPTDTVAVDVHRQVGGEEVLEGSRAGPGLLNFHWYSSETLYADAYVNDAAVGRTGMITPTRIL